MLICYFCHCLLLSDGHTRAVEKEMATHSSTLAWKIPLIEEPCRLQSMGLQRVRHDWATSLHFTSHWSWGLWNFKRLWQTPGHQEDGARSDCWVTLSELRVCFESFTWHKSAIWPQAIFCLLYATKNSENHALSAVETLLPNEACSTK